MNLACILALMFPIVAATTPQETPWGEVGRNATSPAEICGIVRNRVHYQMKHSAHGVAAKVVWERKWGNCVDYCTVIQALCRRRGWGSTTYVLRSTVNHKAHAVLLGRFRGELWMSSNGDYRYVGTVKEAKQKVCRDFGWALDDTTFGFEGVGQRD